MISLNGQELNILPGGLKLSSSVISDNKTWYTRQLLTQAMEKNYQKGFELTAITGKRHYVTYAEEASIDPTSEIAYRKILQTAVTINGINLKVSESVSLYNAYKCNQVEWRQKQIYLQRLRDPEITITAINTLNDDLKNHAFTTMPLNMFGSSLTVFFNQGASCNFNYLVHDNYVDFSFNLLAWELLE